MAGDSRDALIDAGIELVVAQRWQDLGSAVSTRAITERAGVTTGSFFHHFRNRAHFAEAMATRDVELWLANAQRLTGDLETSAIGGGPAGMRSVAEADWAAIERDELISGLHSLLWVGRQQPLGDDTAVTAGEVLGDAYRSLSEAVLPTYRQALGELGREMLPPFQLDDLAVALTAVADGLQMRHGVDPGSVRDGLYADLIAALVIALTRPIGEQADGAELAALEVRLGAPRPDVRPAPDENGRSTWRQIAEAAEPLFVDRAVADVRIADIATAAGVSTSTVYHQFGSVTHVAAATWARHIPELQAIATNPLTTDEGPIVRLEQVLTCFIEIGQKNRGAMEGLVLVAVGNAGPGGHDARVQRWPPVWSLLVPHIRELRTRGLLRRRIDADRLARSMIQLSSIRTLLALDEPVERIIDETLGLLLEGALARTDGR